MIRKAIASDFLNLPTKNCAVRIESLYRAYGLDTNFLQFYTDGIGGIASLMDGCCFLHLTNDISEEWMAFLHLLPNLKTLYTDETIGAQVVKVFGFSHKITPVMRLKKQMLTSVQSLEAPPLQPLYHLLKHVFVEYTPFDSWYVDISHRIRHNNCHIASVIRNEQPIACAMTVAEAKHAVIIGGVATDEAYRQQGLAQQCIEQLLSAIPQQTIFIVPINDYARRYYERFGFTVYEQQMEIDFS